MEVDETKAKIYARFNNQVSRDIDRVPSFDSFFFFLFYFLASKVCLLLTAAFYAAEIIINHFSQTNARKASNLNKFDEHGTCIVVCLCFRMNYIVVYCSSLIPGYTFS